MESSEDQETIAREYVQAIVDAGKAEELMEAYSIHMQSCYYADSLVVWAAREHSSEDVRNFATNLMEEWGK